MSLSKTIASFVIEICLQIRFYASFFLFYHHSCHCNAAFFVMRTLLENRDFLELRIMCRIASEVVSHDKENDSTTLHLFLVMLIFFPLSLQMFPMGARGKPKQSLDFLTVKAERICFIDCFVCGIACSKWRKTNFYQIYAKLIPSRSKANSNIGYAEIFRKTVSVYILIYVL